MSSYDIIIYDDVLRGIVLVEKIKAIKCVFSHEMEKNRIEKITFKTQEWTQTFAPVSSIVDDGDCVN